MTQLGHSGAMGTFSSRPETLHEVLERTGWHSGQHTRQIILMLQEKLGITPDAPLVDADFAGLPMPKNIWDNERSFGEDAYAEVAEG